MKKLLIGLLIMCSSCGASHYLKHAEKDLAKAKAKGAKVELDTTYAKRTFNLKGGSATVNLQPLFHPVGDGTKYILKDTVIREKGKPTIIIQHDTIKCDCPDSV